MAEIDENLSATVPKQPAARPPLRKTMPVVIALVVIVGLIGIANLSSLLSGNKKAAPQSALTMSPTTSNAQQVSSFQTQQQMQARHDAEEQQRQQELAAAMQQLQQEQAVPGPEASATPPMTAAQRSLAIYGESPKRSTAHLQMSPRRRRRPNKRDSRSKSNNKMRSIAVRLRSTSPGKLVPRQVRDFSARIGGQGRGTAGRRSVSKGAACQKFAHCLKALKRIQCQPTDFDQYQGQLPTASSKARSSKSVVTNHVDGGISGPILCDAND